MQNPKYVVAHGKNDGSIPVILEKDLEFNSLEAAQKYIKEYQDGKPTEFNHYEILEAVEGRERWEDYPSIECILL